MKQRKPRKLPKAVRPEEYTSDRKEFHNKLMKFLLNQINFHFERFGDGTYLLMNEKEYLGTLLSMVNSYGDLKKEILADFIFMNYPFKNETKKTKKTS